MEMKTKLITRTALVSAAILILIGCATPGPSTGFSGPPRYYGRGAGTSQTEALNTAKMDAVEKAVVEMIGVPASTAKRPDLDRAIYVVPNANLFVINDSLELLGRERDGDIWRVDIMIQVDLAAVERVLRDHGIWGGKVTPGSPFGSGAVGAQGTPPPQTAQPTVTEPSGAEGADEPKYGTVEPEETPEATAPEDPELTPEEREFLNEYVSRMIYMVYFDEESAEDPFLMKSAVTMANGYLAKQGIRVVDSDQVEELKRDQQLAFEEQTGREMTMIQWIAQRLNADVYFELDATTSGETEGNRHYGKALVTVKVFEASTGTLLGSTPYNSPRTFSTSSQLDAINNALQSSIYKAMPLAMNQAKVYMRDALRDGINYDLIVQNTPDPRLMSDFRRKLERRAEDVRTLSASAEETRYQVAFIGTIEELEDTIYDVTEGIPGLEGMYRVFFRGKSITFDTGLY
jgi:hypothetical protein